jgi:hypothetical protein
MSAPRLINLYDLTREQLRRDAAGARRAADGCVRRVDAHPCDGQPE